jgi:hypothetical protein
MRTLGITTANLALLTFFRSQLSKGIDGFGQQCVSKSSFFSLQPNIMADSKEDGDENTGLIV